MCDSVGAVLHVIPNSSDVSVQTDADGDDGDSLSELL